MQSPLYSQNQTYTRLTLSICYRKMQTGTDDKFFNTTIGIASDIIGSNFECIDSQETQNEDTLMQFSVRLNFIFAVDTKSKG